MSFAAQFSLAGTGVVSPTPQGALAGKSHFGHIGSQRCCENGRLIVTDPSSGQTICTCQMKIGPQAYMPKVPSLSETLCSSATSHMYPATGLLGAEPSAFYPMANLPAESLKVASAGTPFYFDNLLASNPYGSFYPGLDLNNAARRKNATRETTSALKAWLYEHRKNPYPTKGEKIMLAIITRMTLTQVSTWFANARRRLKKETKMGWSSKEGDDENDDCDLSTSERDDDHDGRGTGDNLSSQCSTSDEDEILRVSDISDAEDQVNPKQSHSSNEYLQRLYACANGQQNLQQNSSLNTLAQKLQRDNGSLLNVSSHQGNTLQDSQEKTNTVSQNIPRNCVTTGSGSKPKIWSISEIIGSNDNSSSTSRTEATANVTSPIMHVCSGSTMPSFTLSSARVELCSNPTSDTKIQDNENINSAKV